MSTAAAVLASVGLLAAVAVTVFGARRRLALRDELDEARTAARRAEQRRFEADLVAGRLLASLDVLHVGLVVCDREGAVVARSAAATRVLSARQGEALVAKAMNDVIERALRGEAAGECVELHSERRRCYEVEARPVVRDGESLGVAGLVREVTEQRRIDEVRRDFVANVSHELKTPIGALSLLAESLAADPSPEVFERLAGRIRSEALRASAIVDDLLVLSSIEHESRPLDESADVAELAQACLDRIAETAEQRKVIVKGPETVVAATIAGSRAQLESALFNLLDNAVKFSDPAGLVTLSVFVEDTTLKLIVTDEGPGIPAVEQDRVFERFYRVDRARSRNTGGTGLGLSIVRHAVLNHGGEVTVSSYEGAGATFTIALPIVHAQHL